MYAFSTNVTFAKDGFYDIIVKAVDQSDNSSSIARKVFVDSSVPQINVTAPKLVAENKEEVTLKLNLKDNFNYLSLFVNDNHEYEKAIVGPVDVLTPANDNVEVKVAINRGENKISLKLRDLAGNETVKEVVINRANVTGWKQEDGSWYYYNNSIKATGWLKGGNTWYFLDKDGKMQTGWFKDKNKWYFLTKSGAMAENQWVLDHNKWYYLGKDGVMQTGWIHLSGKWYYLNAKGEMATGWVLLNGKWYYLNASGDMATGWKQIGGKWYYLYTSGQLAVNTTINGYKVNKDGTWVK